MTGLHTGHTYVRGNREIQPMGQLPLPAGTVTLPQVLKRAGYATALIGKWGLGGPDSTGTPNRQGFDYFFGYLCQRHAHNYYPEFLFRNDQRVPLQNKVAGGRLDGAGVATEKVEYSAT
jgi:arylsulfatase A